MRASFIIPLYNCLPLTQAMLASLRETLPAGLECEIIFVDDGSTDGTRAWLANLPAPCRALLQEKNSGFAAACNRGAAAATGGVLLFLNNDLILQPGWFEPLLWACEKVPRVGLVGNVQRNTATGAIDHTAIYFDYRGKPAHCTGLPLTTRLFGWPRWEAAEAVTGACFAIRRDAWEKLGGFDEGFVNGAEDVDLALRATAAGLHHYVALRSVVRHHISASPGRKLRDEQNTFRLVSRWHDQIARLAAHDWCRWFIELHWDQSFVFDYALAREALLGWLFPVVSAGVAEGVRASLAVELQRWRELLECAPPGRPARSPDLPRI